MAKRNFILGAGISGLIFKHYNPDYAVISPNVGGQMRMNIKAPRMIHDTKETRKLLNELNIPFKKKVIKIKYFYNNKLHNDIDKKNMTKLINKKLSHSLFTIKSNKISDYTLSVKKNRLTYLDCDMDRLLKVLSKNVDIINKKAILISIKNKYITTSDYEKYDFDNLVSTIPAPDFTYVCFDYRFRNNFYYLPATIAISKFIPMFFKPETWDWLYYCDDDQIYSRISKTNDGKYVYEIAGDLNKSECESLLGFNVEDHSIQRVSTIYSEKVNGLKCIKFLGRLATWQHGYKIQDVIKASKMKWQKKN